MQEAAGPGRLISGRYRLAEVVGRGGMGVVWRARDELLQRDVAVKGPTWPASLSPAEQRAACRRAASEAEAAARLSHRNVVRIFDVVEVDGCPWIVMELLPPRSLRDLVREEGPLSPARAAEVGLEVLAALRAAHAAGIVHRDVKPANILMAPGRVVLTDFGIAQSAGDPAQTMTGALVGSPSYIAPERALGRQAGPPADLWGLGASLYAAVEGHGPFDRDGGALVSLTAAVADEPAPAVYAGPLWPVISGLLRKDPGQRLGAAEAERMLRQVAALTAPARPGASAAPARPGGPRHRRPRVPAVALAASAALVVLAASGAAADLSLTRSPRQAPAPATGRAFPVQAGSRAPAAAPRAPAAGPQPPAAGPGISPPAGTRLDARLSRASSQSAPADAGPPPGRGGGRHARPPGQARGGKHGRGNGRHQA